MPDDDYKPLRDGGDAIEELLSNPPANVDEFRRRLRGIDINAARDRARDILLTGGVATAVRPLLCRALTELGVGPNWDVLAAIVADADRPLPYRADVLSILKELDEARATRLVEALWSGDQVALAEQHVVEVLETVEANPDHAQVFSDILEDCPPADRRARFQRLERVRVEWGTPAALVWGPALRNRRLGSLHHRLLESVIEEGGTAGIELLEGALRDAREEEARRELRKALLRLRTKEAQPDNRQQVNGRTFVSTCDGEGTVVVVGCFPSSRGTVRTAYLSLGLTRGIHSASWLSTESMQGAHVFLDRLREEGETAFTEIPLRDAAELVLEARSRASRPGREVTKKGMAPLALFERAARSSVSTADSTSTASAASQAARASARPDTASTDDFRQLLEEPFHTSWVFHRGELAHVGVLALPPRGSSRKWRSEAAAALAGSEGQQLLMVLLEFMARWYRSSGDERRAALCATGLKQCEDDFEDSAVLHAILDRTARIARENAEAIANTPVPFGDTRLRRWLRRKLFCDIGLARGRDLARLDFTEISYVLMDAVTIQLPISSRPREEEVCRAAATLGRLAADFFVRLNTGKGYPTLDGLLDQLFLALDDQFDLSDRVARELSADTLLRRFQHFAEATCGNCPVACLERPDDELDATFRADDHPSWAP